MEREITEMRNSSHYARKTITVREPTFERFKKLGDLSQTQDSILTALLEIGEQKLIEQREGTR